jgi:hypothetical protein
MAPGKRGLNAWTQPRNSRGQFAPTREVIFIDSDGDDVSSEVRVPRGKRIKGEPSTPIPAKKNIKGESSTPTPVKKNPNPGNKGKNKVRSAFPLLAKPFFSNIHDYRREISRTNKHLIV